MAIHGFWCTAYWMCSMYRYQCCHYSVFFNMVFFFVLYIFVWMLYHKIIMWSNLEYINCCVWCYGDDETAIFFYFDILVFHILYIRWELIKKKKKSRNNTITPPFPKIDLIMDHTLKIFGQPCPYEEKKRLGWTDYDFWWWFQFMCNVPYAFNHCLCVWVCDPYVCPTGLIAWCIKDYIMIFWCTLVSSIITYYNKKKMFIYKNLCWFFWLESWPDKKVIFIWALDSY